MRAKSLWLSYFLWLAGGPFLSLHHLYLARDYQWFLWVSSGAICGVGWLADGMRMRFYVSQANFYQWHHELHDTWAERKGSKVLDLQLVRGVGSFLFAFYYEMIFRLAISNEKGPVWYFIGVLGTAIVHSVAVHLCFSAGEKQTKFTWIVTYAIMCNLSVMFWQSKILPPNFQERHAIGFLLIKLFPISSTAIVGWFLQSYRLNLEGLASRHSLWKRAPGAILFFVCWSFLFSRALYFNLHVPSGNDGADVRTMEDIIYGDSGRNGIILHAKHFGKKLVTDVQARMREKRNSQIDFQYL